MERAQRIIEAPTPPEGISTDPSWFECKFCEHAGLCHGTAAPLPTCRSCSHSTPELAAPGLAPCKRQGVGRSRTESRVPVAPVIPVLLKNWPS